MAESLKLRLNAREILVSPSHEGLATLVDHLFTRKESNQYQEARALYLFFVSDFPNCLTLKLLKVYLHSPSGVTRFRSIYLLSDTLTDLRLRDVELSPDALYEIKPLLISCLTKQETKESDVKILRRIVNCIAFNVIVLRIIDDGGKWDELSDCIFSLAETEPLKAFHVFVDLPLVYEDFIMKIFAKVLKKADEVFLHPKEEEEDSVETWSLALQTLVKMWIQVLNTGKRYDEVMETQIPIVLRSVKELVEKGKETFLVRGLEDFEKFFSRDMDMYDYTEDQCRFVSKCMKEIEGEGGTKTEEIVRKIRMVMEPNNRGIIKNRGEEEFDRDWYDYLKNLSSLEVLKIFASDDLEDRSREIAVRRLNVLLSDHTSKKVVIDIADIRELQPLLIYCLKEEGISNSVFEVLGQVVNHVACEIFVYQDEKWNGLRDYIEWQTETEFLKAVYVFQCLTMALLDDDFVIDVLENLVPMISTILNPPAESLFDNSYWVLGFTGAFCAVIQLIEIRSHRECFKQMVHKMIDSVRVLVERRMEVGLVRRAFRDVERIVKKQLEWYTTSQYKFMKGLLWKLYAIEDMEWASKVVLWRINVIVESGVKENEKELPNDDDDWLG